MVSQAEVATSVCRYIPQCPLYGASKGYAISGISKIYAQCIGCGAKWISSDFPKFKEINEMALYECADDGRGISLESIRMRPIFFGKTGLSFRKFWKTKEPVACKQAKRSARGNVLSAHSWSILESAILLDNARDSSFLPILKTNR